MTDTSRRQVIAATATGTTLSLAGCSALDDDETPDTESSDSGVTIAVDIEERIAEREAEIQQQLEDEELSQEEAQAEFQTAQLEALQKRRRGGRVGCGRHRWAHSERDQHPSRSASR